MDLPSNLIGYYTPRSAYKPKHPQLWRSCIGAWAPSLGISGIRLPNMAANTGDGILTNMDRPTDWVNSYGSWALDFDGVNDYVLMGIDSSRRWATFPGTSANQVFSISAWFRSSSTNTNRNICGWGNTSSDLMHAWVGFGGSAGVPRFEYRDGSFSTHSVNATTARNDGYWHHVVVVRWPSNLQIYVDGKLEGSNTTFSPSGASFSTFAIGVMHRSGPSQYWTGQIDDVRLYETKLIQPQIKLLSTRRCISYERDQENYPRILRNHPLFIKDSNHPLARTGT